VSRDRNTTAGSQEEVMLVLSRKLSQQILIGSDISITVVKIEGNHVRLGIDAPPGVSILRQELVGRQDTKDSREADRASRRGIHAS
jgi:carbon storage regulator